MKLNLLLIGGFLTVILVSVALTGLVSFSNAENTIERTGQNKVAGIAGLEVVADLKVDKIETFFNELKIDTEVYKNDIVIKENLPIVAEFVNDRNNPAYVEAKSQLDQQLKPTREIKEFIDIILLNSAGEIVYTTDNIHPEDELGESFFVDVPGLKAVMMDKENVEIIHFSDIFPSTYGESGFEMLVSAQIMNNGNVIGLLVIGIDMTPIYNFIQDYTGLGETGETLIGKREGDTALFLNPLRHDPDAALKRWVSYSDSKALPIREATQGKEGSGLTVDYRPVPVLAAWRSIDLPSDLHWGLVAKIDQEESLEQVNILRRNIILIGLLMLIFGLLSSLSLNYAIATPIKRITHVVNQVSKGNFKAQAKKVGTVDEINDLNQSLNRVMASMKLAILRTGVSKEELGLKENKKTQTSRPLKKISKTTIKRK